jgi:hypothetical protein
VLLFGVLVFLRPLSGQGIAAEHDANKIRGVVSGVKACGAGGGMFSGFGVAVNQLGDDASVSVLKGLNSKELTKPEIIRGYLCIVRIAFYAPDRILREEDRIPAVTLFVLQCLRKNEAADGDLVAQISSTEAYVRDHTVERPNSTEDSGTSKHQHQ